MDVPGGWQQHCRRVIALIDMDCFYAQVEERDQPQFRGKPCTVVQYRPYRGGGIIAVNYEARAKGIKRDGMMGDDATAICPEVHNFRVTETRGKADLTKYRKASSEVFSVLKSSCPFVERASVDEAYLDLTDLVEKRIASWPKTLSEDTKISLDLLPNTHVISSQEVEDSSAAIQFFLQTLSHVDDFQHNPDAKLAIGAIIVEEIRARVFSETQFRCSAGIAHNKIVAKIGCGINKPNKQTILTHKSVQHFFATLPVHKLKNLGGKLGHIVKEELSCETVGDLLKYSESFLINRFGDRSGKFLFNIARGLNDEDVKNRLVVKSIGCSKNFLGRDSLKSAQSIDHWAKQLCEELEERLKEDMIANDRVFRLLTVSYTFSRGHQGSKACPLIKYCAIAMKTEVVKVVLSAVKIDPNSRLFEDAVVNLGVYAGKEEKRTENVKSVRDFFAVTDEPLPFVKKTSISNPILEKKPNPRSSLDTFLEKIKKIPVSQSENSFVPLTTPKKNVSFEQDLSGYQSEEELFEDIIHLSDESNLDEDLSVIYSPQNCIVTASKSTTVLKNVEPTDSLSSAQRSRSSSPFDYNNPIVPGSSSLVTSDLIDSNAGFFIEKDSDGEQMDVECLDRDSLYPDCSTSHSCSTAGLFTKHSSPARLSIHVTPESSSTSSRKLSSSGQNSKKSKISANQKSKNGKVCKNSAKSSSMKQVAISFDTNSQNKSKNKKTPITSTQNRNSLQSTSNNSSIKVLFENASKDEIPKDIYKPFPEDPIMQICILCHENISVIDSVTHRDFHVALKLHNRYRQS